MPSVPVACPKCRTWFEASGNSVRCQACGHRFRADTAALNRDARHSQVERPAESWTMDPGRRSEPSEATPDRREEADYRWQPAYGRTEPDQRDDGVELESPDQAEQSSGPNLNTLLTIAFLALIFIGPRFLDGGLFIGLVVLLGVVRWLYGRVSRTS